MPAVTDQSRRQRCDPSAAAGIQRQVSSNFAIDVPDRLIAAAAGGDMAALERLYRLFERPAYTLCLRLLADPDDAREALHDAMLHAFGKLAQFRGDAPFWAWLRQIVANTALMRLRKRRRFGGVETVLDDDDAEMSAPIAVSPSMAAEGAVLERALAMLPDATRSVIWLYCVEGYSHAEIAQAMTQSVSFSKSQLARGLARLRRLLNIDEVTHAGCA